jgi:DNA-binding transcriptional regulator YhcF (GntR family)
MKKPVTELIRIDPTLATPIYKQIVQSICRNIEDGVLVRDDVLPSVNRISEEFSLARGSVFTAYNDLRASGIIDSIPGKGYFVSSTETKQNKRIFLLFNAFTTYQEPLYNALIKNLPSTCTVHIYFHHHDLKTFETLIREQAGYYNIFIIMPTIHDNTLNILSHLDHKRTFLLNVGYKEYKKEYPGVFQNFEKDIYKVLMANQHLVSKYRHLTLVFPEGAQIKEITAGFHKFSKKAGITAAVKSSIEAEAIAKGDAFITTDDKHLVDIVELAKANKWQLGKDIGVLSYNETSLKSVIGDGITTFTTDFEAMGKGIAEMVVSGRRDVIENPFELVDRKSF